MSDASGNLTITMCITELDRGGAERAFVNVAVGLQSLGWQVNVVSLRDAGVMAVPLRAAGIDVVALNCGGMTDFRSAIRLLRHLRRQPTDVLLTFLHQANFYGRLAGTAASIRTIVSGIRVADRRPWVLMSDRWTRGLVHHYVAVSASVARLHAAKCRIDADAVSVIPNGVEVPPAEPSLPPTQSDPRGRLLFIGRLTEQKNPLLLLDVFEHLPDTVQSNTRLTFVGDGPLRQELQQQIKRRGLESAVEMVGAVDDATVYLLDAMVLLLPSRWEGMPNVVLEAMAAEVPVVASRVDGVCDVLTDGETGWLQNSSDPRLWAKTVAEILQQRGGVAQRVSAAKTLVERDYRWQTVIEKYDHLLRKLSAIHRRDR